MNSFFKSFEYINLLEASISSGNKSATYYKLNSKTRDLLGERQGSLRNETVITNKNYVDSLVKEIICKLTSNNKLSIKKALALCNVSYHNFKHYFNSTQKDLIYSSKQLNNK